MADRSDTLTETCEITLRVTADPDEFRGGDGHPSTPLIERVRAELTAALEELGATVEVVSAARLGLLRGALVGLVGVDGRADLEQMEAVMRLTPAPAQDKAVTIDAIHALIATLDPAGATPAE